MCIPSIAGPVFLCEAITASRRWHGYALRATLVLAMLVGMWVAWLGTRESLQEDPAAVPRFMAELGQQIYYGIAGVQLALVLLAAPAATAGAVCLDRARGGSPTCSSPSSRTPRSCSGSSRPVRVGHGPGAGRAAGAGPLPAPGGGHPGGDRDPDGRLAGDLPPGLLPGLRPVGARVGPTRC